MFGGFFLGGGGGRVLLEYREGWTLFEMRKRRTPSWSFHLPLLLPLEPMAPCSPALGSGTECEPSPSCTALSTPPTATQEERPCPQASPGTQGQAPLSHCLTDPGLSRAAVLPLHQLPWRFAAIPMANATTHQNTNHQIHTRHRQHSPLAAEPSLAFGSSGTCPGPAAQSGSAGSGSPQEGAGAICPLSAVTCQDLSSRGHRVSPSTQCTEPRHCTQHGGLHSPGGSGQAAPHGCCRTPPYRGTGPV